MKGIYLLLGSNLGNKKKILLDAQKLLKVHVGKIINSSSLYISQAWGVEDQPDFLNQVIELDSSLNAQEILTKINNIETQLGRVRRLKWHERVIDIDILYFGNAIIDDINLQVPHPENQNRNFVLAPMTEIAPNLIHPILNLDQLELQNICSDTLLVKLIPA